MFADTIQKPNVLLKLKQGADYFSKQLLDHAIDHGGTFAKAGLLCR